MIRFIRNLFSTDPKRRYYAVKLLGDFVFGDYRATWSELDWLNDKDFDAYLDLFDERKGFNTHRKIALWELLRLTRFVEGDTAECGVYKGASSFLICAANAENPQSPREHHLFDSFEGLSSPSEKDGSHWEAGALAAGVELVAKNLARYSDQLVFHKGWIPTQFDRVASKHFSFVHVDVDLAEPTLHCLDFFYDRLSPGAIFLCDDYAFTTCPGATEVIDSFLESKAEKMIKLPGGGGFFVKGIRTGRAGRLPLDPK
jgi:O-methyltransferase